MKNRKLELLAVAVLGGLSFNANAFQHGDVVGFDPQKIQHFLNGNTHRCPAPPDADDKAGAKAAFVDPQTEIE